MFARRPLFPSIAALALGVGVVGCLAGCSGFGARILSVGQSVEVGDLTITYLGSVTEDAMLTGTKVGNEGYPASSETDYIRYVFEVTNPTDQECKAKEVLPASFAYGTGEDVEEAFPPPGYVSKDEEGAGDETIAPGGTEEVSLIVELPKEQAENPELLTTTLDLDGQAWEIQGDTVEQGGDFQATTRDVAEDFAELLMTRYQDFIYTANEEAVRDPETAYRTVKDTAATMADAIGIYDEELDSMEVPTLYAETAAPLQALLDRFEDYFDQLAKLDPSNPDAREEQLDRLNRQLEAELPDIHADAEAAIREMPYLQGTNFDNLVAYFNDLTNYDVTPVEPLD